MLALDWDEFYQWVVAPTMILILAVIIKRLDGRNTKQHGFNMTELQEIKQNQTVIHTYQLQHNDQVLSTLANHAERLDEIKDVASAAAAQASENRKTLSCVLDRLNGKT